MEKSKNIWFPGKFIILLFFINFFIISFKFTILYSQVQQEWIRYYPAIFPEDMALDDSGNVYIAGIAANTRYIYFTIKYSPSGTILWVNDDSAGTVAKAICVDKYHNVYVTGFRSNPQHDFCTIKYDQSGKRQWINYFDGPVHGEDEGEVIVVDNANNIYVSGLAKLPEGTMFLQQ